MIGGFYVVGYEASEAVPGRDYISLIVGPFTTWAEADKFGPASVKHVKDNYHNAKNVTFGICEFYSHKLVLGVRNNQLWAKPSPIEKV